MTELYQISEHMSSTHLFISIFYAKIFQEKNNRNVPWKDSAKRGKMAREKLQRELTLKLKSKYFGPKDSPPVEDIVLLHEEMEAVQLMDQLNMYQEDAAKQMNVSRPTFARIIKSARKKIATALITGSNLKIHEVKNEFHVAVCSSSKEDLESIAVDAPYIFIFHIKDYKMQSQLCVNNPAHQADVKPNAVLPDILHEYTANYFITDKIGTSMKNSMINKGIYPIIREEMSISTLIDTFK